MSYWTRFLSYFRKKPASSAAPPPALSPGTVTIQPVATDPAPVSTAIPSATTALVTAATVAIVLGVTITNPWGSNLSKTIASLKALPYRATSRIVYDEAGMTAADFCNAAHQIHAVADTMAEIIDSQFAKNFSDQQLADRTTALLKTCAADIDIVEVANEINGNWVGPNAAAQLAAVYDAAKAMNKKTAVTYYLDCPGCVAAQYELFNWLDKNTPARILTGADFALISFYKDDQNGYQPDWNQVFTKLAARFPTAGLGIGEYGATIAGHKQPYSDECYSLSKTVTVPRFITGCFWWYYDSGDTGIVATTIAKLSGLFK